MAAGGWAGRRLEPARLQAVRWTMPASIQAGDSAAGPLAGRSRSCLSPRPHSDDNEGPAELIEGQGHGAAPSAARSAAQRFSSLLPVKEVGAAAPGSSAGVLWQAWCVHEQ